MSAINQKEALEQRINFLKNKQENDLSQLKNQYSITVESLKPINLIKSSFQNIVDSPNLKSNLLIGAVGIGTNFISKTFLNENSINPVKRVIAKDLKFAVSNLIKRGF